MGPEGRLSALATAARLCRDDLVGLADRFLEGDSDVAVLDPATPASVLLELEVPVGAFALAEVVITQAHVSVEGHDGWGAVLGCDEVGATAVAILDGAVAASTSLTGEVTALCRAAEAAAARELAAEQNAVAATVLPT